jgi:hypothetical protein
MYHIVTLLANKFDGGKVYNLCNRGSWHARCYGGALRMNLGPEWSCKVWEDSTGTEPGYHFVPKFEAVILFFLSECQRPE